MKEGMESLEITAVVREFQSLVGGYIQKVYRPGEDTLTFRLHVPGTGKKTLLFKVGSALYLTEKDISNPMDPGGFVMLLRKHLGNARIEAIRQHEFDRVVVFELSGRRRFKLIFEIFGKGNLVLAVQDDILLPYRSESWRHRDLKKGEAYRFPPSRINPFELGPEDIRQEVLDSKSDLVRTLAVGLNFGGKYAEEICMRMGVDKNTKELEPLVDDIIDQLDKVRSALFEEGLQPRVVFEGEEILDAVPFPLSMYEDHGSEVKETYNEALDTAFLPLPPDTREKKAKSKIERRLERQQDALESQKKGITENQIKGELIYQNYNLVDGLLNTILKAREEGIREEVFQGLSQEDEVLQINDADEYVIVDLKGEYEGEEVSLDVRLDFRKDVNGNAQMYYEKSKTCRRKVEGTKKAIEQTEKKIRDGMPEEERKKKEPTAKFWFDRFKWFLSSEDKLVVAGKDAQSNEEVVKKYLEKNCRYAHAEAGGAPSVVVRKGEGTISEETLKEACQFALIHSKEWKRGIAAGTAYWVKPSQVSKTPEAGESLPTGAFVIRGKRNYVTDIPMEAVLTEVEYRGKRKVMCAPSWSFGDDLDGTVKGVLFRPGKTPVGEFAKEMSHRFRVPIEEIQSILPPGDVNIIKKKG